MITCTELQPCSHKPFVQWVPSYDSDCAAFFHKGTQSVKDAVNAVWDHAEHHRWERVGN